MHAQTFDSYWTTGEFLIDAMETAIAQTTEDDDVREFQLVHSARSKASDDIDVKPEVANALSNYRRYGTVALRQTPNSAFKEICSFGFTGETYYDYDKGLDPDHPIVILHFNDVYNIEPQPDGNGGISRFVTALKQFADSNPLILFSGDAFNPSFVSTFTKGRHMVPFLNMLKIHTACVGNHDLDFGIDHLEYLSGSTSFPWLLSNIFDAYNVDRPLAGAGLYRLFEWQGHRFGVIGLVEQEWIKTLSQVNEEDIVYKDYVEAANQLCSLLRSKECELIIALTHMRAPNDERLAREAKDIDIILGGHDHDYYGVRKIAKSGTDFREFTAITIYPGVISSPRMSNGDDGTTLAPSFGCLKPMPLEERMGGAFPMPKFCGGSILEWDYVAVNPTTFPTNRHVDKLVSKYIAELDKHMESLLGESGVYLETRFPEIRTRETNVGNWLADLMKANTKADVACLNSGTVRSDCIFKPGVLRVRDLVAMLPMPDELVVIKADSSVLKAALEVSVSEYPKTEGRFLQVSGLRFAFDPLKPSGSRVVSIDIQTSGRNGKFSFRPLEDNETLTICTKAYLADGKDGFECFKGLPIVMSGEECPNLPTMVRNSFSLAAMASGRRKPRNPSAMSEDEQQHWCGMTIKENGVCSLNCQVEGRIKALLPSPA